MSTIKSHKHFKKSALILKVNTVILLFIVLFTFILHPYLGNVPALLELIIGLSGLFLMILAPIGLIESIKSNKRKEGNTQQRFLHRLGHLVFCLLVVLIISVLVKDMIKLFSM